MKNLIAIFLLTFATALMMTSCGGPSTEQQPAEQETVTTDDHAGHNHADHDHSNAESKDGPEYTSAYICPMHCPGSGSDQPGICPVCKMDYVANPDAKPQPAPEDAGGEETTEEQGNG